MTRQAWLFIAGAGALAVLGCVGIAAVALILGAVEDDDNSRCREASFSTLAAIGQGLDDGLAIGSGHYIQSGDFERVYFIAADITGPGVDVEGVWATNRMSGNGVTFAVNDAARRYSDWNPGPDLSMNDDGATEVLGCD